MPPRTAKRRVLALALGLAAASLLPSAGAQQAASAPLEGARLDYRLGLRIEHSDNITRVAEAAVTDTVLAPNLAFSLSSEGERLSLRATGDAEYLSYRDDSFASELNLRAGLQGNLRLLPERLSWAFEDYVGRQPIDAFAVDRPDNQQRTNVFATGPTLSLRPSPTSRVLAELRYLDSWAEETAEFNSERLSFALRALWQRSATSSLSAHAETSDAEFERGGGVLDGFRRNDAYVRYDRRGAAIEWSADVGGSRIDFDGGGDDSAALLRLRYAQALTDSSRLELRAQRQFSDAVADLAFSAPRIEDFDLPIGLPGLRGGFLSPEPFLETGASLGFSRRSPRLFLRAEAYAREQDYLLGPELDQDGRGLRLALSRPLRSALALGAYASLDRRGYDALDRVDRETSLGLQLDWRILANLDLSLGLLRARRDSSAAGQDFTDNRVLLGLVYRRD